MRPSCQYLLSDMQIADGQETLSGLLAQGPVDVGNQVIGALQSHRDANYPVAQPNSRTSFGSHRTMGCRRRMGDKGFRVAQVVGDVDQLQFVQYLKSPPLGCAVRDVELEGDHGATAGHLP